MMKKLAKQFRHGEKGFTLIELLVVVAILGILAAIAIPNVSKFIGSGKTEAARSERHNAQTSVVAAMADKQVGTITGGTLSSTADVAVGTGFVGDYIVGGNESLQGTYTVGTDGKVVITAYPGLTVLPP